MKRTLAASLWICACLWLAAAASADSLAEIVERGTLRVGVSAFVPWTFENRNGDLEGFEVDVGRRIAHDMGVEPEFRVYVWDEIIAGLERGEIDVIAAGMAITPNRALRIDFSSPYSESGTSVAVNRTLVPDEVTDIEDLNRAGFVIATVDATLSSETAPLYFDEAEIEVFLEPEGAEEALLDGRAHAYLASIPEVEMLVAQFPTSVTMPLHEPLVGYVAGLAVEQGNQSLLNFLNSWIAASRADGWLEATDDYWFDAAAWLPEAPR